ncbi:hypothetical protein L2Y94_16395 [Luteibacter aegosomatis]|uniref:hypothetical protein n=1 Tax=Luteibacter aegosomatis TaxID=2911537 RepID=UPI001FF94920|nr:hypothetical protein [Luteibacter aegosomatis]UPG84884.1 hypothetical protein L2Y94_16395 [Luteibacter aegosomatis]
MNTEDDDTPASSLQAVHKLSRPDPLHDLQLLRDLAIINERTEREFGPRSRQAVLVEPKRKPNIERSRRMTLMPEEHSDMNPLNMAMAAALGLSSTPSVMASETALAAEKSVPAAIRSLVEPGRQVLAYRSVKTNDEGDQLVALVTRWQTRGPDPAKAESEWDVEYACELALFESKDGKLVAVGRNGKVVDCEYNHINRVAAELELNDQLEVSPTSVTFLNDNIRGGSYSYSFKSSRGSWHASGAVSYYVDHAASAEADEVVVAREKASYPRDFKYMPMDGFDPDDIHDALARNKSIDW